MLCFSIWLLCCVCFVALCLLRCAALLYMEALLCWCCSLGAKLRRVVLCCFALRCFALLFVSTHSFVLRCVALLFCVALHLAVLR